MTLRWLAGSLAGWLIASALASAQEPASFASAIAILPQAPPTERPDALPNIDPRLDIVPLIRTPAPKRAPACGSCPSDYDPSYLFLPESNPGQRQPPCPCLPLGTWWFNAAYFLGVTESNAAPPLATMGGNGVLGSPGTSVVHANDRLEQPFRSGMRLETGAWLDRCHDWGFDGSFFFMQSTQAQFQAASAGDPVLARPYFGQPGNVPMAQLLAAPGLSQGALSVNSPLTFLGADVNGRRNLWCEDKYRLDFLAGYRFIRMSEQVDVRSRSLSADGTFMEEDDLYRSVNTFNGAQIGLAGEYRVDRFYLGLEMKAALGVNSSSLDAGGETATQALGAPAVLTPGGLLTRSILSTIRDARFAVAPEANFTVGYQVAEHWRAYLGYTFVYISSVARPGQAIDLNVGPNATASGNGNTDFWMHGINFGIEARY
jgi:hypothetical protein